MRNLLLSAILITCALAFGSCAKSDTNTNHEAGMPANKNMATTTATPSMSPMASSGEKIGIAECDNFIAAYDACVSGKVPEMARAQYKNTLEQWRKSWQSLAANPQTKGTLATACKTAMEQARQSMKTYGCTF